MLPSLSPPEQLVPIVGFIANNNWRTCKEHRFGCYNVLLLRRPAHGCGVLLRLRKISEWTGSCFVRHDGSDGWRVGFTLRKHAAGARGCALNGTHPEYPNSHSRALYHRNRGYAIAEIVVDGCNLLIVFRHNEINWSWIHSSFSYVNYKLIRQPIQILFPWLLPPSLSSVQHLQESM